MACPFSVQDVMDIYMQLLSQLNKADYAQFMSGLNKVELATMLEQGTYASGSKMSATDAESIADVFYGAYMRFIDNLSDANRAERKIAKQMAQLDQAKYGPSYKSHIRRNIDTAFLFVDSESQFQKRMEAIRADIMRRQDGYNWSIVRESIYMVPLLGFKFLTDVFITNGMMALTRRITMRAQLSGGTGETKDNKLNAMLTPIELQSTRLAIANAKDIMRGGAPITATLSERATDQMLRSSEYGVVPNSKAWTPYFSMHRALAKVSSRLNNALDSGFGTASFEQQFYIYTQQRVLKEIENSSPKSRPPIVKRSSDTGRVTVTNDKITINQPGGVATTNIPSGARVLVKTGDHVNAGDVVMEVDQVGIVTEVDADKIVVAYEDDAGEFSYDTHKLEPHDGKTIVVNVAPGEMVNNKELATVSYSAVGVQVLAMRRFFTSTPQEAYASAVKMFEDAGYIVGEQRPTTHESFYYLGVLHTGYMNTDSAEFLRAVEDMRRNRRNAEDKMNALRIMQNDFFKSRTGYFGGEPTPNVILNIADRGISGIPLSLELVQQDLVRNFVYMATTGVFMPFSQSLAQKASVRVEAVTSALSLAVFGFIRGAMNFVENVLEFTPYGYLKAGIMKSAISHAGTDTAYYQQRMTDMVARATTGAFVAAALAGIKAVIEQFGGCEESDTLSDNDVREGKVFVICGNKIPAWWTGMARGSVLSLTYLLDDKKFTASDFIAASTFLTSMDNRGASTLVGNWMAANNDASRDEAERSFYNYAAQTIAKSAVSFMPVPRSNINDAAGVLLPKSEELPAKKSVLDYARWAAMQQLGIKEIIASSSSGLYPVVDYRGREMPNPWRRYNLAKGGYDKFDDKINRYGIGGTTLYNGRYRVLFSAEKYRFAEDKFGTEQRFMTEKEFFYVQKSGGNLLDKYLKFDNGNGGKGLGTEKDKLVTALKDIEDIGRGMVEKYWRAIDDDKIDQAKFEKLMLVEMIERNNRRQQQGDPVFYFFK